MGFLIKNFFKVRKSVKENGTHFYKRDTDFLEMILIIKEKPQSDVWFIYSNKNVEVRNKGEYAVTMEPPHQQIFDGHFDLLKT